MWTGLVPIPCSAVTLFSDCRIHALTEHACLRLRPPKWCTVCLPSFSFLSVPRAVDTLRIALLTSSGVECALLFPVDAVLRYAAGQLTSVSSVLLWSPTAAVRASTQPPQQQGCGMTASHRTAAGSDMRQAGLGCNPATWWCIGSSPAGLKRPSTVPPSPTRLLSSICSLLMSRSAPPQLPLCLPDSHFINIARRLSSPIFCTTLGLCWLSRWVRIMTLKSCFFSRLRFLPSLLFVTCRYYYCCKIYVILMRHRHLHRIP